MLLRGAAALGRAVRARERARGLAVDLDPHDGAVHADVEGRLGPSDEGLHEAEEPRLLRGGQGARGRR
ncbi:hypothetical protein [Streptomyces sp. NPDC050121]|uniref:hypothetical protein n=1 Tax=Streptomyces sp. NPDC050121 TaxID=3365601 RepID=UPI00379F2700